MPFFKVFLWLLLSFFILPLHAEEEEAAEETDSTEAVSSISASDIQTLIDAKVTEKNRQNKSDDSLGFLKDCATIAFPVRQEFCCDSDFGYDSFLLLDTPFKNKNIFQWDDEEVYSWELSSKWNGADNQIEKKALYNVEAYNKNPYTWVKLQDQYLTALAKKTLLIHKLNKNVGFWGGLAAVGVFPSYVYTEPDTDAINSEKNASYGSYQFYSFLSNTKIPVNRKNNRYIKTLVESGLPSSKIIPMQGIDLLSNFFEMGMVEKKSTTDTSSILKLHYFKTDMKETEENLTKYDAYQDFGNLNPEKNLTDEEYKSQFELAKEGIKERVFVPLASEQSAQHTDEAMQIRNKRRKDLIAAVNRYASILKDYNFDGTFKGNDTCIRDTSSHTGMRTRENCAIEASSGMRDRVALINTNILYLDSKAIVSGFLNASSLMESAIYDSELMAGLAPVRAQ